MATSAQSAPVTSGPGMPVSHNNPFDQSGGHLDQHPNVAFEQDKIGNDAGHEMTKERSQSPREDRRMSREWDTSKVPPSQFQRRKGSIYATPGSRDGHVKGAERDKAYFDKLKEKGWDMLKKAKS